MPSTYAHYRLGFRTLSHLDAPIQKLLRRNRQLFDLGLHGPDFLFYCNPFRKNEPMSALGSQLHHQTGRAFFTRGARLLRLKGDDRAQSYLFGVLGHFALDSLCHPYIDAHHCPQTSHTRMETELDMALLERDGKPDPYRQVLSRHIRLESRADAERIAQFYSGVTAGAVRRGMENMAWMEAALAAPKGPRRTIIASGALGNSIREHMMGLTPDPACAGHTQQLLDLYHQAEADFPELARQLWNHLHAARPLGDAFDREFG